MVREKIICNGPTRAAKEGQKPLVPARQAHVTNQGRTPFIYIHHEFPLVSVSTVSRGHPSLVTVNLWAAPFLIV